MQNRTMPTPTVPVQPVMSEMGEFGPFNTEDQPELRAMIAHQAITILFTIFGNLLMM